MIDLHPTVFQSAREHELGMPHPCQILMLPSPLPVRTLIIIIPTITRNPITSITLKITLIIQTLPSTKTNR
jgi:hypothetical protein